MFLLMFLALKPQLRVLSVHPTILSFFFQHKMVLEKKNVEKEKVSQDLAFEKTKKRVPKKKVLQGNARNRQLLLKTLLAKNSRKETNRNFQSLHECCKWVVERIKTHLFKKKHPFFGVNTVCCHDQNCLPTATQFFIKKLCFLPLTH